MKEPISRPKRAYFGMRLSLFRNPFNPILESERAYFGNSKSLFGFFVMSTSQPHYSLLTARNTLFVLLNSTYFNQQQSVPN